MTNKCHYHHQQHPQYLKYIKNHTFRKDFKRKIHFKEVMSAKTNIKQTTHKTKSSQNKNNQIFFIAEEKICNMRHRTKNINRLTPQPSSTTIFI